MVFTNTMVAFRNLIQVATLFFLGFYNWFLFVGFESLINSTAETECSEGEFSSGYLELRDEVKRRNFEKQGTSHDGRGEAERISTVGTIPKRRSPRQVALGSKVDGIERLVKIKTGKRNLNVDNEEERERMIYATNVSFVNM